ncbi:TIM barrel protein [Autumnicola musiva]|uniref:TIM barrel protein n=1 Tax=Autumnicola musiva TaxID=3075589 RepID=A0ABU3D7P6_9FLAO|nr:TIM barrel protein [Zunongwangia sp. F117]MDT0677561.1 TIM barrel protein [Zunongwangia sp. F117]
MSEQFEKNTARRDFIKKTALGSLGVYLGSSFISANAFSLHRLKEERYKIAVCDWMILKRQKLSAFSFANELNADGIEMDMGGLGDRVTFDNKLGDPEIRAQFLQKSKETGVEISSVAMSGFYAQSFAERPTVHLMVKDCIDVMEEMKVKNAYLPLGVKGDMIKYPELRPEIVKRLKWAGQEVGEIGGVIGVETSYDAKAEKEFLEEIGSPNIKSSFNFANAIKNEKDICMELEILGNENIAQIHASNTDGELIENDPALNMPAVKKTLDKMNWKGWLIVERSRDTDHVHDRKANYGANVAYLKSVFQNK